MTPPNLIRILLVAMSPAFSAVLPYQGILTDDKGVPVADGPKEISFTLYGQSTGGSPLWTEPRVATTRKGLFSLALGTAAPLPDSLFARESLFVGVTVSGTALTPRTLLGTSPWAFRAHKADTAKFALDAQGLGTKVDSGALTSRLASYAPLSALATYAPITSLAGYAKVTDLASYAKTTDLASYARTTALANYATTASVAGKMNTADYVQNGHLKALGGLVGGRGMTGAFTGSAIRLDTNALVLEAADKMLSMTHNSLTWGAGYDQWTISALPGNAFTLVYGNRMFDLNVLTITSSGAAFAGDVEIGGSLKVAGTTMNVPDYVFEPNYKLASLSEVEAYIQANKHLPEVPSAKEIQAEGMDLAETNLALLRKVEELTLHAIAQEKRIQAQEQRLLTLEDRLK